MNAGVWNPIAGKLVPNVFSGIVRIGASGQIVIDHDQPALIVECSREITGFLFCGRNGRKKLVRTSLPATLIIHEEERPVTNDASAHGCPKLVADEKTSRNLIAVVRPTVGIQMIVAQKL